MQSIAEAINFFGPMEFGWGWLGKNNKQKERESSVDDKNPKHHRRNWSEVVKDSSVALRNAATSGACHSQSSVTIPTPTSPRKCTVSLTKLNPNGVYTSEKVIALLAEAKKANNGTNSGDNDG